jgi:hypothetical protein
VLQNSIATARNKNARFIKISLKYMFRIYTMTHESVIYLRIREKKAYLIYYFQIPLLASSLSPFVKGGLRGILFSTSLLL